VIVEADSTARMSRILRGAGPMEHSSILELVTVRGDGEGDRSPLGASAACPHQRRNRVMPMAVSTEPFTVIAGHGASQDARERAYDPAIDPSWPGRLLSMDARVESRHREIAITARRLKRQRVRVTQLGTPLVEWPE